MDRVMRCQATGGNIMQTTATERVWMDYRSACEYTSYDRTTLWRAIK